MMIEGLLGYRKGVRGQYVLLSGNRLDGTKEEQTKARSVLTVWVGEKER